jgi:hypothetical protein
MISRRRFIAATSLGFASSRVFAQEKRAPQNRDVPPSRLLNARQFGAVGDGRADDSVTLKSLHDAALARGDRFAEVDAGTYFAPLLRDAGDVIFVGQGKLITPYRKFVIPKDAPTPPPPPCQVRPNLHLRQFARSPSPVVCVWGDSMARPDPNGITSSESFWTMLCERMVMDNPAKQIRFVNRAIGATTWGMAASVPRPGINLPAWYDSPARSWESYVRQLQPDVLVLAFGVNDSWGFRAEQLVSLMTMIEAWDKRPDILFCTCRCPSLMERGGETPEAQNGRDYIAAFIRGFALRNGYGLLDFNRRLTLVRDGFDYVSQAFERLADRPSAFPISFPRAVYDFGIRMNIHGAGPDLWSKLGVVHVQIGNPRITSENVLLLSRDEETGNLAIEVKATASYSPIGRFVSHASLSIDPSRGTFLEIFVKGNEISVAVEDPDNVVLLREVERYGGPFIPMIGCDGPPPPLQVAAMTAGRPILYMPELTDREAWGTTDGGDPIGGNGFNHLTTLQAELVDEAVLAAQISPSKNQASELTENEYHLCRRQPSTLCYGRLSAAARKRESRLFADQLSNKRRTVRANHQDRRRKGNNKSAIRCRFSRSARGTATRSRLPLQRRGRSRANLYQRAQAFRFLPAVAGCKHARYPARNCPVRPGL